MTEKGICSYCGKDITADGNQDFIVAAYRDELYRYCNPNCLALHFCEISEGSAAGKDGE